MSPAAACSEMFLGRWFFEKKKQFLGRSIWFTELSENTKKTLQKIFFAAGNL